MHRITLSKILLWLGDFFAFFSSFFIALVLLPLINNSHAIFPKGELDEYIFDSFPYPYSTRDSKLFCPGKWNRSSYGHRSSYDLPSADMHLEFLLFSPYTHLLKIG